MIYLGADHAGFCLKEEIKKYLSKLGIDFEDLGNIKFESKDDYPDFALKVAKKVSENKNNRGILICSSGEGMSIVANKVKGVRAATAFNLKRVQNLREKNDINVLTLAADEIKENLAKKIVSTFLKTKFSKFRKHQRRLKKIEKLEENL